MSDTVMIEFTEDKVNVCVRDITPEQFAQRRAAGDYSSLLLDRPSVRISHGQAAGARFIERGVIQEKGQGKPAAIETMKTERTSPTDSKQDKPVVESVVIPPAKDNVNAAPTVPVVPPAPTAPAVSPAADLPAPNASGGSVDRPAPGGPRTRKGSRKGVEQPAGEVVPADAASPAGDAPGIDRGSVDGGEGDAGGRDAPTGDSDV